MPVYAWQPQSNTGIWHCTAAIFEGCTSWCSGPDVGRVLGLCIGGFATAAACAVLTPRCVCTGAELSNIVNEALLLTARRGGEAVGLAELLEGLSRTRYGVNGNGSSGAQTALGRRLGKWLMNSLQQQQTKAVKVATS